MNPQKPKGLRVAIARLAEHLNRHPDDVGLFVTGLFIIFILLFVIYGIGWHEGYGAGREAKNYPPPPGFEELQHYLRDLRK
jgi:hypothetical protein